MGTHNDLFAAHSGASAVERVARLYGIDNWGLGYFRINSEGHLAVSPRRDPNRSIDLYQTVRDLVERKQSTPFLLRFPQILDDRLDEIHRAFRNAIKEFDYSGGHRGVYPVKVNQKAEVVRRLVESGGRYGYGLEVGGKAELLAALAQPLSDDALIVCNGLKDETLLRMAILSERFGRRTVLVVEDVADLIAVLEMGAELRILPEIGMRVKLDSRGSGKWEGSGGELAKFGMSAITLVEALRTLAERGQADRLKMLHFHIGSQITDIRRAKQAFKEAARVYAKVREMGFDVEFLNVGGGLGVDYDGSKTASEFSVNYSVQEFANDIIYTVGEVCAAEKAPPPTIVTEAGRAMVAYHSVLVTDVRKVIRPGGDGDYSVETIESEAQPVRELLGVAREINAKNFREYYHDALEDREDLNKLFELGYLSLEDKAKGEWLFWQICRRAVRLSHSMKQRPEEFEELEKLLASKYVCNFSMFQSLPDFWAFDQLFPILPIHRLAELPTERGVLCDITCDSDGTVDKFVDVRDVKESLELHVVRAGEPYYLAFLLVGAYQETLGDLHNLLGEVSEAGVSIDSAGEVHIDDGKQGDTAQEVLSYTGHDPAELRHALSLRLSQRRDSGLLSTQDEAAALEATSRALEDYTYLR